MLVHSPVSLTCWGSLSRLQRHRIGLGKDRNPQTQGTPVAWKTRVVCLHSIDQSSRQFFTLTDNRSMFTVMRHNRAVYESLTSSRSKHVFHSIRALLRYEIVRSKLLVLIQQIT